jgi:hypothetical protein
MRASKSWGSRRQGLFLQLQMRIPALEHSPEFLVQGFHPHCQQQMRTPLGPLQLLLLTEALADDLVDGRLDKTGADVLPIPVALAVVGDEGAIALDISVELLYGPQELSCRAIPCGGHGYIFITTIRRAATPWLALAASARACGQSRP